MSARSSAIRALEPARRGYFIVYRPEEVNHCPGCGRSHWYVGRLSAECGFCGTALPLVASGMVGAGLIRRGRSAVFEDSGYLADAA